MVCNKHQSRIGWHGNSDFVLENQHLVVVHHRIQWFKCMGVEIVTVLIVACLSSNNQKVLSVLFLCCFSKELLINTRGIFGSEHFLWSSLSHGECRTLLDLESVEPGGKGVSEFKCILLSQEHISVSEIFCFPEGEPWAVDDADLSAIGVVLNLRLRLLVWANESCSDVGSKRFSIRYWESSPDSLIKGNGNSQRLVQTWVCSTNFSSSFTD